MKKHKIDRVMLSTTNDPLYIEGIQFVAQAWKNMGVEVSIIYVGGDCPSMTENDHWIQSMEDLGIKDQNLAKVMRVVMTQAYPADNCLISDADMIPLNENYFTNGSLLSEDRSILFYTRELTGEDKGKYPACYMLAKGNTFGKYINPDNLPTSSLVGQWRFGKMENVSELPFSDESLYRRLFVDAPKILLDRYHQDQRLCRSNWNPDAEKLKNHDYIDCHMLRPFSKHKDELFFVFESIGIDIS